MNDYDLSTALAEAAGPAKAFLDHVARHRQYALTGGLPPGYIQQFMPVQQARQACYQRLVKCLESHAVFGAAQTRFFGNMQLPLAPSSLALTLINGMNERDPAAAVAWCHKLHATHEADVRVIAEVHGLKAHRGYHLSNGASLLPLDELPSQHSAALIKGYRHIDRNAVMFPFFTERYEPLGAIVTVPKMRGTHDIGAADQTARARLTIENVVKAFTLIGDAAPVVGNSWTEFVDPDLQAATHGQSWRPPQFDDAPGRTFPVAIDRASIFWVERYLSLPEPRRLFFDIALDRLNLARRRQASGNKAIEGSICLEALLGDDSPQDLTYKASLRAALVLTLDVSERRRISQAVKVFYALRSATVHGRRRRPNRDDAAIAAEGLRICTCLIYAMLAMRDQFEPEKWEFSGGSPPDPP